MKAPPARWLKRLGIATTLLLTAGLFGLALTSGPSGATYSSGGRAVLAADELIAQVDRDFLRNAHREDAALHGDARCYLSHAGPGASVEVERHLRCGPIVHFGGDDVAPWDSVPLRTVATAEGVRLEPDGDAVRGQALAADERLSRPDGADPPRSFDLDQPGPPRVGPGQVIVTSNLAGETELRRVDTALSGPGDGRVEVVEVGVADSLRLRDGLRRPAVAEEFVVARVRARQPAGASLELVAGQRRQPVPDADRLTPASFVVASVSPGTDALLEVTYRGVSQRVSLRTGAPDAGGSPLVAGPVPVDINRTVDRQEAPVTLGGATTAVSLAAFEVSQALLVAHSEWLGTAPPGQGWLSISVAGLSAPSVSGADRVALDLAASFMAVLPDGRSIGAIELGPSEGGRRFVYLAVPDTLRSVILRVSPTYTVEAIGQTAALSYPAVEVPVIFR